MTIPAPLPTPSSWGGRFAPDKRPIWSGMVADFNGIRSLVKFNSEGKSSTIALDDIIGRVRQLIEKCDVFTITRTGIQ